MILFTKKYIPRPPDRISTIRRNKYSSNVCMYCTHLRRLHLGADPILSRAISSRAYCTFVFNVRTILIIIFYQCKEREKFVDCLKSLSELGSHRQFIVSLHSGHNTADFGRTQEQLRDLENTSRSWRDAPHSSRRQV